MGKEIVGLMNCPECGLEGAQVKRQKNGLAYRFCPDCAAQYFPRDEAASNRLLSKIKPVTVTAEIETPGPVTKTETETKPAKKSGFSLGGL
jgi:Zn-finger nucleic acid-binding protein